MVYRVMSLVMAILVVLSGCATGPTASPQAGTGQKEANAQAEKPKPAAEQPKTSAEQPKPAAEPAKPAPKPPAAPTGTLISAIGSFGEDRLDPILAGAANNAALVAPMFDGLARDRGDSRLEPELAESWTLSSDGKAWTFKIKKGVKFHNGDEVTSADVKFSLERIISSKSRAANAGGLRQTIDGVDAPDPYTMVVTTKDVNVGFIDIVASLDVMPKKYIEEKGEDYFGSNPVGTGSWRFVKHEAGASLELEAVKNHWNETPAFEKLVIKQVPEESTRMAMLKRGEVDIIDITLERVDEVKAAGFEVRSALYDTAFLMHLPATWLSEGRPTSDIRVRQALALAINRPEIAREFFKGFAKPSTMFKMSTYSFAWDPNWKPVPYDLGKAKTLLAEAGYPAKFQDPVVTLYSYPMAGATWVPQLVQIVSGYWEAAGVKTKITPIDFGAMRTMYMARPVDARLFGATYAQTMGADRNPISTIYAGWGTKGVAPVNNDLEWDALYGKTLRELDEGKRIDLLRQLMVRGADQYVTNMVVDQKNLYAVSNKVGKWDTLLSTLGGAYAGVQHK